MVGGALDCAEGAGGVVTTHMPDEMENGS